MGSAPEVTSAAASKTVSSEGSAADKDGAGALDTPPPPPMVDSSPLKAPRSARQAIEPETPPPPPTRSKAVRHPIVVFMNFVFTVIILAVVAAGGLLYYGKQSFLEEGPLRKEKTIVVSNGTGLGTIAGILERQNVISNKMIFEYGVQLYRQEGALKAGEYLFGPGISMHQVMNILTSGKSILHSFTIPEGYTSYQVVEALKANDVLLGEVKTLPEEGTILPETYKFSRGTTRAELLKRMVSAHNRAVDEIWARRASDLPLKDKREFVTLASIVEKETGNAAERTRVAGVFVNRLNQGMRLQTDPTVIYGIFGGQGKPSGRPIFRSDLDKPTPYNTYQIDGLPPGPIANPGRAALEAVANPSRTNDLFFVADGTGGHVFSETLKQHNENVKRWREIEKQRIEGLKNQGAAQPES
nr:endolytic transglycosylase MltG [uncultured Cohaesibacter sp.]